ncbi:uncharacterized protein [Notamacropus eugenii]|uniref:uncharacterized protein isoform X2 n=1 Tax=Notamacropus eugenii TaxID=9315 RepID=UPI003B67321C
MYHSNLKPLMSSKMSGQESYCLQIHITNPRGRAKMAAWKDAHTHSSEPTTHRTSVKRNPRQILEQQRPQNSGAKEISVPEGPANLSQMVLHSTDWAQQTGSRAQPCRSRGTERSRAKQAAETESPAAAWVSPPTGILVLWGSPTPFHPSGIQVKVPERPADLSQRVFTLRTGHWDWELSAALPRLRHREEQIRAGFRDGISSGRTSPPTHRWKAPSTTG